jgi:hypothetical protein
MDPKWYTQPHKNFTNLTNLHKQTSQTSSELFKGQDERKIGTELAQDGFCEEVGIEGGVEGGFGICGEVDGLEWLMGGSEEEGLWRGALTGFATWVCLDWTRFAT